VIRFAAGLAIAVLTFGLVACGKSDGSSDASRSPDTATTASDSATLIPASPSAVVGTSASPGAPSPSAPVALTDIAGVNGEKEISELAQLGAIDPTSGTFEPGSPIKRRDFIRWLVKANNALWSDTPAHRVQLADKTETSAFPDVATTDPDFPYVQGMQDAGYSVGFPDKTFKPDQSLTREQMFAIKNVFDRGNVDPGLAKDLTYARTTALAPWKDRAAISKTYVAAIATGSGGGNDSFALVYGASSIFKPQQAVTRAQAAVAVSTVGDHVFAGSTKRTAAQVLAASPAP
jgi:hypothetical protein